MVDNLSGWTKPHNRNNENEISFVLSMKQRVHPKDVRISHKPHSNERNLITVSHVRGFSDFQPRRCVQGQRYFLPQKLQRGPTNPWMNIMPYPG